MLLVAVSLPYSLHAIISGRNQAQETTHAGFDAACRWIEEHFPGLVLTRHPAEVFWQTGLQAVAPTDNDPNTIAQIIARYQVNILLVDDDRYAGAPINPLRRFIETRPPGDRTLKLLKRWDHVAVYFTSRK